MSNVLTVIYDKAEPKLDSAIAAVVNELHNLGHVVKEVRVMGDSGEAKVALNMVEGIIDPTTGTAKPAEPSQPAPAIADTASNKAPDGTSPVSPIEGVPLDTPPAQAALTAEPTIDQKREALLAQLEELDKEEEATTAPAEEGSADPTNSGAGTTTPATA